MTIRRRSSVQSKAADQTSTTRLQNLKAKKKVCQAIKSLPVSRLSRYPLCHVATADRSSRSCSTPKVQITMARKGRSTFEAVFAKGQKLFRNTFANRTSQACCKTARHRALDGRADGTACHALLNSATRSHEQLLTRLDLQDVRSFTAMSWHEEIQSCWRGSFHCSYMVNCVVLPLTIVDVFAETLEKSASLTAESWARIPQEASVQSSTPLQGRPSLRLLVTGRDGLQAYAVGLGQEEVNENLAFSGLNSRLQSFIS